MIYLDACLLMYLVERHAVWGPLVAAAMANVQNAAFAISPLVKCECLVGPFKSDDQVLRNAYTDVFRVFVTLDMRSRYFCWQHAIAPVWG